MRTNDEFFALLTRNFWFFRQLFGAVILSGAKDLIELGQYRYDPSFRCAALRMTGFCLVAAYGCIAILDQYVVNLQIFYKRHAGKKPIMELSLPSHMICAYPYAEYTKTLSNRFQQLLKKEYRAAVRRNKQYRDRHHLLSGTLGKRKLKIIFRLKLDNVVRRGRSQ